MSSNQSGETDEFALLPEAFGSALRVEAARKGMTQLALVERTGLSKGTIGNYWHGRQTPRLKEMTVLSRALGVEVGDFYDRIMAEHARMQS
ncbi:helix-turn-helix transcriptional regulator [Promicromonospora thailandica]|uniref:Cro/C1-type HTH DNA-binding domain-containing protein n=1 Tax=Promicromonospora thailandica TaxID=765201 RepID=A0A9X2JWH0_9MICO|nr:helix-turn-helix transcriptional regulator [Promicromonospora thailandica]MCP2265532.1 Cro/C1-type HTH DNA-binding domain-containing protein [Promicromonospora thailandica]